MSPAPSRFPIAAACLATACLATGLGAAAAGGQQFVDETATRFPTPAATDYSNQATVGDLDGDGDLDLVFANGGNFASPGSPQVQRVYVNDGTGVFTDESAARLGFSALARGAELGDVDGDGDLDLVFAQDFDRQPALFVNDGNGFFTDVTAEQLPALPLSSSRAQFGDIDNDGDLDLYLTNGVGSRFGCGQYQVWVNDGLGTFVDETAARHPIENVCENMDCIFGDVDNDFDLDVRTGSTGAANSRLYVNDGAGVFALSTSIPADNNAYSYDFGDIDGDGDLDLLGANANPSSLGELLLLNDGTGSFTDVSNRLDPNPSEDDNDSKFFDYDDDGDLDLVIARLGGTSEKVYENDGDGNFVLVPGVIQAVSDSSLDLVVADFDGDGRLDVVTAQGESGSFVNRIYVNGGPADDRAPRIVATEVPADPQPGEPFYVVRALVLDDMTSDRNFFDRGVTLHYSVDGGAELEAAMRYSGGQVYRGLVPGQESGALVEYFVTARDWADNLGTGAAQSFHVGGIFADGFESGDTSAWSLTVP
ncbi:MAG: VCBS repeat-containing protein [Acidobacteriota bacterium]|nr:VCBS repeat-containing protein [Acidobacteriota bacterium]MDH3523124.1 VCBS repeat-containing protein [Acidobacteriota bacterium]